MTYVFDQVEGNIVKSLYVDDGALWVRGWNIEFLRRKMQNVTGKVEQKWGFKLSISKSQVTCFSKRP